MTIARWLPREHQYVHHALLRHQRVHRSSKLWQRVGRNGEAYSAISPASSSGKISEDFLAAGVGGKQIENIHDADTKAPQATPSAALRRIDGNSTGFAHVGHGASLPVLLITLAANGNSDDFTG